MCLATMACIYAACTVRVTIFNIGGKFIKYYRVICSYSSHPFLCGLNSHVVA